MYSVFHTRVSGSCQHLWLLIHCGRSFASLFGRGLLSHAWIHAHVLNRSTAVERGTLSAYKYACLSLTKFSPIEWILIFTRKWLFPGLVKSSVPSGYVSDLESRSPLGVTFGFALPLFARESKVLWKRMFSSKGQKDGHVRFNCSLRCSSFEALLREWRLVFALRLFFQRIEKTLNLKRFIWNGFWGTPFISELFFYL